LNSLVAIDITNRIYYQTFNLVNNGTFVAYPRYTFAMQDIATKIVFYNFNLGRRFTYTATFGGSGKTLVLDTSLFTILNDGTEDLVNWSGDFIWLIPGTNNMQVDITFASSHGTGNIITAGFTDRNY
jgi:hypothetical protein